MTFKLPSKSRAFIIIPAPFSASTTPTTPPPSPRCSSYCLSPPLCAAPRTLTPLDEISPLWLIDSKSPGADLFPVWFQPTSSSSFPSYRATSGVPYEVSGGERTTVADRVFYVETKTMMMQQYSCLSPVSVPPLRNGHEQRYRYKDP